MSCLFFLGRGGGCALILKEVSSRAEGRLSESWCANRVQTKGGKSLIVEVEKQYDAFMEDGNKAGIVETRGFEFVCFFFLLVRVCIYGHSLSGECACLVESEGVDKCVFTVIMLTSTQFL